MNSTYNNPIFSPIMLTGIVTSSISKYLPGPGSHVIRQEIAFSKPTFYYTLITFMLKVKEKDVHKNEITVHAIAKDEQEEVVLEGLFTVLPPKVL